MALLLEDDAVPYSGTALGADGNPVQVQRATDRAILLYGGEAPQAQEEDTDPAPGGTMGELNDLWLLDLNRLDLRHDDPADRTYCEWVRVAEELLPSGLSRGALAVKDGEWWFYGGQNLGVSSDRIYRGDLTDPQVSSSLIEPSEAVHSFIGDPGDSAADAGCAFEGVRHFCVGPDDCSYSSTQGSCLLSPGDTVETLAIPDDVLDIADYSALFCDSLLPYALGYLDAGQVGQLACEHPPSSCAGCGQAPPIAQPWQEVRACEQDPICAPSSGRERLFEEYVFQDAGHADWLASVARLRDVIDLEGRSHHASAWVPSEGAMLVLGGTDSLDSNWPVDQFELVGRNGNVEATVPLPFLEQFRRSAYPQLVDETAGIKDGAVAWTGWTYDYGAKSFSGSPTDIVVWGGTYYQLQPPATYWDNGGTQERDWRNWGQRDWSDFPAYFAHVSGSVPTHYNHPDIPAGPIRSSMAVGIGSSEVSPEVLGLDLFVTRGGVDAAGDELPGMEVRKVSTGEIVRSWPALEGAYGASGAYDPVSQTLVVFDSGKTRFLHREFDGGAIHPMAHLSYTRPWIEAHSVDANNDWHVTIGYEVQATCDVDGPCYIHNVELEAQDFKSAGMSVSSVEVNGVPASESSAPYSFSSPVTIGDSAGWTRVSVDAVITPQASPEHFVTAPSESGLFSTTREGDDWSTLVGFPLLPKDVWRTSTFTLGGYRFPTGGGWAADGVVAPCGTFGVPMPAGPGGDCTWLSSEAEPAKDLADDVRIAHFPGVRHFATVYFDGGGSVRSLEVYVDESFESDDDYRGLIEDYIPRSGQVAQLPSVPSPWKTRAIGEDASWVYHHVGAHPTRAIGWGTLLIRRGDGDYIVDGRPADGVTNAVFADIAWAAGRRAKGCDLVYDLMSRTGSVCLPNQAGIQSLAAHELAHIAQYNTKVSYSGAGELVREGVPVVMEAQLYPALTRYQLAWGKTLRMLSFAKDDTASFVEYRDIAAAFGKSDVNIMDNAQYRIMPVLLVETSSFALKEAVAGRNFEIWKQDLRTLHNGVVDEVGLATFLNSFVPDYVAGDYWTSRVRGAAGTEPFISVVRPDSVLSGDVHLVQPQCDVQLNSTFNGSASYLSPLKIPYTIRCDDLDPGAGALPGFCGGSIGSVEPVLPSEMRVMGPYCARTRNTSPPSSPSHGRMRILMGGVDLIPGARSGGVLLDRPSEVWKADRHYCGSATAACGNDQDGDGVPDWEEAWLEASVPSPWVGTLNDWFDADGDCYFEPENFPHSNESETFSFLSPITIPPDHNCDGYPWPGWVSLQP